MGPSRNQTSGLSPLEEVDPEPLLAALDRPPLGWTRLGRQGARRPGRGETTEYRLTYSVGELTGALAAVAGLANPAQRTLAVYVWLDAKGRVREERASGVLLTEPPSPSPAQAALANQLPTTVTVTLLLSSFGLPAPHVQPPPANEVTAVPASRLWTGLPIAGLRTGLSRS